MQNYQNLTEDGLRVVFTHCIKGAVDMGVVDESNHVAALRLLQVAFQGLLVLDAQDVDAMNGYADNEPLALLVAKLAFPDPDYERMGL